MKVGGMCMYVLKTKEVIFELIETLYSDNASAFDILGGLVWFKSTVLSFSRAIITPSKPNGCFN